jgi:hypothetical protein
VQKYPLFDDRREEFGDFSFPNDSFSSEADTVLTFLLTFCVKTKSKSGFGAEAPRKQIDYFLNALRVVT